ncbi:YchJ family protein [Sanguibacter sp. HDW7]|uniref:YchJ family protein n=1 Tax=Sanguibacter sp. HDW7 TaxID=2714931 RepID=UPI001407AEF3|nr:YchJ family protein [Sanguibacter sp. HDW7]QIK84742.1 YchJ family protein [Sanguibacter sp. HDW7]
MPTTCPCGSGSPLGTCCLPILHGERPAATATELMRSRYTAYVRHDAQHVWRTWHPRTRPAELDLDDGPAWSGLTIHGATGGGPDDETGTVTFTATWDGPDGGGRMHETSRFARRAGRWFYVDGDVDEA